MDLTAEWPAISGLRERSLSGQWRSVTDGHYIETSPLTRKDNDAQTSDLRLL